MLSSDKIDWAWNGKRETISDVTTLNVHYVVNCEMKSLVTNFRSPTERSLTLSDLEKVVFKIIYSLTLPLSPKAPHSTSIITFFSPWRSPSQCCTRSARSRNAAFEPVPKIIPIRVLLSKRAPSTWLFHWHQNVNGGGESKEKSQNRFHWTHLMEIVNYQSASCIIENAKHLNILHSVLLKWGLKQLNDVTANHRWAVEGLRPRYKLGWVEWMLLHRKREREAHRNFSIPSNVFQCHKVFDALSEIIEETNAATKASLVRNVVKLEFFFNKFTFRQLKEDDTEIGSTQIKCKKLALLVAIRKLRNICVFHL